MTFLQISFAKLQSIRHHDSIIRESCTGSQSGRDPRFHLREESKGPPSLDNQTCKLLNCKMLLLLLLSILCLPVTHSAVTPSTLHLVHERHFSPRQFQNVSTPSSTFANNIDSSLPQNDIDPRFTYDRMFISQILDQKSAYLNTLLALADLSTKGWTERLGYESMYIFSKYGDVTIRIHASEKPSSLQYRYAIWGLYRAICEASAHKLQATVLTLYWSPILGGSRHRIGYVSILGASTPTIDIDSSNNDALEQVVPTNADSLQSTSARFTNVLVNNSTAVEINSVFSPKLSFNINLEKKRLDIGAVFQTFYAGIVHLASFNQSDPIMQPGFVKNDAFQIFLRWDWTHIDVKPLFEYQHAIAALSVIPPYMYRYDQFVEVRFIVLIDGVEVGRGWLYKMGINEER